jgi:AAA family ATP:ADP antiporter
MMKKLLRNLFDIREDEGLRVALMFSYIFFIIASLLIIKPVRQSLFLMEMGITQLPIVYTMMAVFSGLVTVVYLRFARNVRLNLLIIYTLLISILSLAFFWILLYLDYHTGWFFYAFYIWVAIFGVITTSQFWLLANYVFDAREAKRLFGFIGAGAISGGIFGGYLTYYLAPVIGTENLIFICIAFLLGCIVIAGKVWEKSAKINYQDRMLQQKRLRQLEAEANPLTLILNSRHLSYLAGIVGISVLVATLVDFQYSAIASRLIEDEDKLTEFFGFWLSTLSVISLVIQLSITSRVLKSFGVGASLFFLPIGILIGAIAIIFNPALWSGVSLKVSEGGFKQSIQKAGVELLTLPIPPDIKNRAKAFIDVFVVNFARGVGGILLIIVVVVMGLSVGYVSLVMISLIAFWIYLNSLIRNEYVNSFRLALEKRSIDLDKQTLNLDDASVFESLIRALESDNEKQILYVLDLIENVKNDRFVPQFERLIHHPSAEVKVKVFRIISVYKDVDFIFEASELVEDSDQEVRVEAMRHLSLHSLDKKATMTKFLYHPDFGVRSAALMCVAIESKEDENFREDEEMVKIVKDMIEEALAFGDGESERSSASINVARVIGTANNPALYPHLETLLRDMDPEVRRVAVISAGKTRSEQFVPILIENLNTKLIRRHAREALANYGEEIIDTLVERLNDKDEDRNIRIGTAKALALIGSQKTVDLLLESLPHSDLILRYEIIKALNKLKVKFPLLDFDEGVTEERILEETRNYIQMLYILDNQDEYVQISGDVDSDHDAAARAGKAKKLLTRALEERLDTNLERIFRLLGLRYPPKDMFNAYQGITSNLAILRANAIEFLDNVLDSNLKNVIIPIVEAKSNTPMIQDMQKQLELEISAQDGCFDLILTGDDNWLKVCALYSIAELQKPECTSRIELQLQSQDPVVKQTAEYAIRRLNRNGSSKN